MSRKIYDSDYRRLTLNQKIDGIRVDAVGVWPDDNAYSEEVLEGLTGEEAAAILERPDGWIPGHPYVRFPCSLEELRHALGVCADAIDEDIATEYELSDPEPNVNPPDSPPSLSDDIRDYLTVPLAALPPQLAEQLKRGLDGIGVTIAQWDAALPKQRAKAAKAADESAAEQAQYARQAKEKQAAGRYTLKEAADAIATRGERVETLLRKLIAAAENGTLPTYGPGELARFRGKPVRTFYEEAYWNDLNEWLATNEPRLVFRFPEPSTRVIIADLASELAIAAADAHPALWATGENDELSRDIAINLLKQRCEWPTAPSVMGHIRLLLESGEIIARNVAYDWPATSIEAPIEHPSEYWLSTEDADKVRARLGFPASGFAAGKLARPPSNTTAEGNQPRNETPSMPASTPTTHRLGSRATPLTAEITEARRLAMDPQNPKSVWDELVKLAEKQTGSLVGYSSDGVQYRGKGYQDTGTPDVFTLKNLRDRMGGARRRAKTRGSA